MYWIRLGFNKGQDYSAYQLQQCRSPLRHALCLYVFGLSTLYIWLYKLFDKRCGQSLCNFVHSCLRSEKVLVKASSTNDKKVILHWRWSEEIALPSLISTYSIWGQLTISSFYSPFLTPAEFSPVMKQKIKLYTFLLPRLLYSVALPVYYQMEWPQLRLAGGREGTGVKWCIWCRREQIVNEEV